MAKVTVSDIHSALVEQGFDVKSVRLKDDDYSVVLNSGDARSANSAAAKIAKDLEYKVERQAKLATLQMTDQMDAVFKLSVGLGGLFKKLGATDQDLKDAGLVPDAEQSTDSPAGWLAFVSDVKQEFPKPEIDQSKKELL